MNQDGGGHTFLYPVVASCLPAGIYTVKLFKEGSWRYLHLDDRLPCWPLRDYYYSSCKDPNQARCRSFPIAWVKLEITSLKRDVWEWQYRPPSAIKAVFGPLVRGPSHIPFLSFIIQQQPKPFY